MRLFKLVAGSHVDYNRNNLNIIVRWKSARRAALLNKNTDAECSERRLLPVGFWLLARSLRSLTISNQHSAKPGRTRLATSS